MFKVKTLNHISPVCRNVLSESSYEIGDKVQNPDAIFVRATNMLDYDFNPELLCIARAGIGVNTIPLDRCSEKGIVVFNSPGGNANGVKELFVFALGMASRDVLGGMNWVYNYQDASTPIAVAMEKTKNQFAGPEYSGKKLGVVGTGNVGSLVANVALDLGMEVYAYDPYLSVDAAWKVSKNVIRVSTLNELLESCDYLTLHVPLTSETRNLINKDSVAHMKKGIRVINYARGEVVNEEAIIEALKSGVVARFVCDFPTEGLIAAPNTILTPHLGGTTIEGEANCALMAAQEMDDYLKNGNIKNSVNMPTLVMPRTGVCRICIIHRNLPGMLTSIMQFFTRDHINIENMTNKSSGSYAYSIFDINTPAGEKILKDLNSIDGLLRIRILN